MIGLLERYPHMRMVQHYSGILFEWLKTNKPEFVSRLAHLVSTGQLEMMTGGFYEPIMSVIPHEDKIGQIRKLTRYVKENTGYEAKGMWLAERIWEPHLAKPIYEAGVRYVVLDDSHFKNAGLKDSELLSYYLTEEEGSKVYLFPISEKLRYTIPFGAPEETVEYLRSVATEDGRTLVVFADDGEKFGVWPGTYEHCYDDGWLASFFEILRDNSDWINIVHFSEALERLRPKGRIYLPTASYREMMEWAMPTLAVKLYEEFEGRLKEDNLYDRYKVFVRGGFWRNFMAKYPESNNMHKKMLHLHRRLKDIDDEESNPEVDQARDHIWAGQCNCPYWHGIFGGLYLPHLRFATYREFLKAERILDRWEHPGADLWLEVSTEDFDCDGFDEILIRNPQVNLYFAPHRGGSCFEIDYKPKAINITDTMTRREEGYHDKLLHMNKESTAGEPSVASIHDRVIAKEEGLDKHLFYDWYKRNNLIDHFFSESTTIEQFSTGEYREAGDFVLAPYEFSTEQDATGSSLKLWRQGRVVMGNGAIAVTVEKSIFLAHDASIDLTYQISNNDDHGQSFWFGSELAFSLLAGDAADRYFSFAGHTLNDSRLRSMGAVENVHSMSLTDEWLGLRIHIRLEKPATVWRLPIETISQSEGGFERVYQSSVVIPTWKFELDAGKVWKTKFSLAIEDLEG